MALHCNISTAALLDIDWKIKCVMGSSTLASMYYPLAAVDIHVSEGGDPSSHRLIKLELDKEEMKTLIDNLESAQQNMLNLGKLSDAKS